MFLISGGVLPSIWHTLVLHNFMKNQCLFEKSKKLRSQCQWDTLIGLITDMNRRIFNPKLTRSN